MSGEGRQVESEPVEVEPAVVELAGRLFDAAREGNAPLLRAYLDAGAPASLRNHVGDSLLMLAAYHGHAEVVRLLAERGAEVDDVNDRGQTPLAGAVFKGHIEVAEVLLALGADPEAGTPTARQAAEMFARTEILALLAP